MIRHSRRHCVVELQALPLRIGQIRRIVSAQLRHWQLDPLIDRAALGVTELLSNVHRHAQPDKTCTVEIELRLGRLTVSVYDSDPRLPVLRASAGAVGVAVAAEAAAATEAAGTDRPDPADALETSGRGLALVEALSEAWGARHRPDGPGKVVWFSLRAAPGPAAPHHPVLLGKTKPVRSPAQAPLTAVPAEPVSAGRPVAASVGARPG
ncbi:ATP-binding protein [Streptomyces sp. ISL-66]|uniref:ATP-binding protein n=1 Tax=Streptomyces sp. ISL-66 TaxID=2819186 RepID=UPI001BEAFE64|nr:ATP-binding protein [Streptomyces sp. ISL-66]MBT2466645.1 ATP-binding protein [Streptomyces sp. ISL-66]